MEVAALFLNMNPSALTATVRHLWQLDVRPWKMLPLE